MGNYSIKNVPSSSPQTLLRLLDLVEVLEESSEVERDN